MADINRHNTTHGDDDEPLCEFIPLDEHDDEPLCELLQPAAPATDIPFEISPEGVKIFHLTRKILESNWCADALQLEMALELSVDTYEKLKTFLHKHSSTASVIFLHDIEHARRLDLELGEPSSEFLQQMRDVAKLRPGTVTQLVDGDQAVCASVFVLNQYQLLFVR